MTITAPTSLSWEKVARASMHPTAVAILELLAAERECPDDTLSPKALAYGVQQPLGSVAYHVRMLAGRGLIVLARTEPARGALAHFYRLADGVTG